MRESTYTIIYPYQSGEVRSSPRKAKAKPWIQPIGHRNARSRPSEEGRGRKEGRICKDPAPTNVEKTRIPLAEASEEAVEEGRWGGGGGALTMATMVGSSAGRRHAWTRRKTEWIRGVEGGPAEESGRWRRVRASEAEPRPVGLLFASRRAGPDRTALLCLCSCVEAVTRCVVVVAINS
jgi:hypothetical protein